MRDESRVESVAGKAEVVALLTAGEVAEMLQVSRQRVYELGREGVVPSVRIGRQVRFDEAALREWVARGGSVEKRQPPLRE